MKRISIFAILLLLMIYLITFTILSWGDITSLGKMNYLPFVLIILFLLESVIALINSKYTFPLFIVITILFQIFTDVNYLVIVGFFVLSLPVLSFIFNIKKQKGTRFSLGYQVIMLIASAMIPILTLSGYIDLQIVLIKYYLFLMISPLIVLLSDNWEKILIEE